MLLKSDYPAPSRGTVIVWGLLSSLPFGGMVWQVLHHLAGFRRLGFDVWYVEDSDRSVMDPETWSLTDDFSASLKYLAAMTERIGLKDRWIFRPPGQPETCYGGKDFQGLLELYKSADAAFNLCGGQEFLPYHEDIRCRVYLETDPALPQILVAQGNPKTIDTLKKYHHIFSYGENIGQADCVLPVEQFRWRPTRPPVILDWWNPARHPPIKKSFTTIANWDTLDKGIQWQGETYFWQKDFTRFIDVARRVSIPLELAVVGIKDDECRRMEEHWWRIRSSRDLSDYDQYRDYIGESLGEFTVSKHIVVKTRTGWFSDRSVCYLAAGRPVITEDTGFSKVIPCGNGLFGYTSADDIVSAVDAVQGNYEHHSNAAREIAAEYYKAETVLGKIVDEIGI